MQVIGGTNMTTTWHWVNNNAGALGLIFVVIPIAWSAWRYLWIKRQELLADRFKTYHGLIKELVEPESSDKQMMLDRQIAIVFELRRFHEYFEPSLSILKGNRELWGQNPDMATKVKRLMDEMDESISYIERKAYNWTHRRTL